MRVLIDTHALLWYYFGDPKLSPAARAILSSPTNDRLVSLASIWEIAIKVGTGKLGLGEPFPDFVQHAVHDNGFVILPITPAHAAGVIGLPFHHRDPFDRMLVAQAAAEGAPLVSCDPDIRAYPVPLLW